VIASRFAEFVDPEMARKPFAYPGMSSNTIAGGDAWR
jgi:hypothetical protein